MNEQNKENGLGSIKLDNGDGTYTLIKNESFNGKEACFMIVRTQWKFPVIRNAYQPQFLASDNTIDLASLTSAIMILVEEINAFQEQTSNTITGIEVLENAYATFPEEKLDTLQQLSADKSYFTEEKLLEFYSKLEVAFEDYYQSVKNWAELEMNKKNNIK